MRIAEAVRYLTGTRQGRMLASLVAVLAFAMAIATGGIAALAQEAQSPAGGDNTLGLKAIGAGLAVGLAGIGGGYAVAIAGAAAISAVAEKRELLGTSLLFVVLGEGIAIYGLLVALIILFVI